MSKPMSYSDKLRGDFRRYLIKIVCNKSDPTLNESEILKAFDLAVQKQKLTSLEAELVLPTQVIISKFDVSGDVAHTDIMLHELIEFVLHVAELETADISETDEPYSAGGARSLLEKYKIKE